MKKAELETEYPEGAKHFHRHAWARKGGERPVGFRITRGDLVCAAVFLLAAAAFFALNPTLLREQEADKPPVIHGGYIAAYAGMTLLGTLLCLLEIRLSRSARRIAGWVLVLLFPLGTFFAVDLINGTRILTFSPLKFFANYLCYLMVFALVYALCRSPWITALAGGGACLGFGIVNYFVIQFRGQPILPWDLSAVATAAEVSQGYKYAVTRPMVLSVLGLACAVLLSLRLCPPEREKPRWKQRLAERLGALAVSLTLIVLIFPCDLLTPMGISVWAWNQKTSAEITGVAAGFCANIQFLLVDKPEDYSPERLEELKAGLAETEEPAPLGNPEGLPTIIAVMNESMTDFSATGDLEYSVDYQSFLHSLQSSGNTVWGTAYSSVYGGNTCNSEYEFLTGNTTAFLPSGSKPYQQYVDKPQTALPSLLKSYGYECTAIHPGNRAAWQRNTAYPWLDFDTFIAARDFTVERELVHGLTTDLSGYHQVIEQYEQGLSEGKPQFIFHVTIQNHGGFKDETVETTVQVKDHEGQWPQTEQYLSLIRRSDEDLQKLVEYFSKRKDPVVLLFFGDHWPNLETGFLSALLGADANNLEFKDLMREYEVPFVIWANYPLEGQKIEQVSLNYLSGLLLRAAGLEGTPYTKYLEGLRQSLPVITAVGTVDNEGNLTKNGEESALDSLLNEYAVLQYNNAFDEDGKVRELFVRQEGESR